MPATPLNAMRPAEGLILKTPLNDAGIDIDPPAEKWLIDAGT